MGRTNWNLMVTGKELGAEKNVRKKMFVSQKIATKDLPSFVDDGWEKCSEFKNPKYVGIAKEKPVEEQFKDQVWTLFANMGFTELNLGIDFSIAYDNHDDDLQEKISVMAVDDETILIACCRATETLIEHGNLMTLVNRDKHCALKLHRCWARNRHPRCTQE